MPKDKEEGELIYLASDELAFADKFHFLEESFISKVEGGRLKGRRLLIMGSGQGTNFEALVHRFKPYSVVFVGLFTDNPSAPIIEKAQRFGIPATIAPQGLQRKALDQMVWDFLSQPFDLLVLAGYMKILPPFIVEAFRDKIINIHPSLLPQFKGLHAVERAFEVGVSHYGVSVHLIDERVDEGILLSQARFPARRPSGERLTLDKTFSKIHKLEHRLYFDTIFRLLMKRALEVKASPRSSN